MKIAVSSMTSSTNSSIDLRFGRAKVFMVFDDAANQWDSIDNVQNMNSNQGAGIQSAAAVVNAGCQIVITGHCGPKAFAALQKAGVSVFTIPGGSVGDAIDSFKNGNLNKIGIPDVEGHW